jgi:hypothetical protein
MIYIMPPGMPPALSFFGASQTEHSVVISKPAI